MDTAIVESAFAVGLLVGVVWGLFSSSLGELLGDVLGDAISRTAWGRRLDERIARRLQALRDPRS